MTMELQNLWNPFRDWNKKFSASPKKSERYKTSETLLGIETYRATAAAQIASRSALQNLWNPFRDWNFAFWCAITVWAVATKPLKPF